MMMPNHPPSSIENHNDAGSTSSSISSGASSSRGYSLHGKTQSSNHRQFDSGEISHKVRSSRINVVKEIVKSERNFAANLSGALEAYARPCERRPDLFDRSWTDRVFAHIERVADFSVAFLAKLEAAARLSPSGDLFSAPIPHVFLQMVRF